jgi:transforming growth factor-beta-induced protein
MKRINKLVFILALLMVPFVLVSCEKEEEDEPKPEMKMDIVEIATSDNTFDSLVVALSTANLVSVFQGDDSGPYTVFAPTNQAFVNLLSALNLDRIADIDMDLLTKVLTYHVVNGSVMSSDLADDMLVKTLSGSTFVVDLDNGAMINTNAMTSVKISNVDVEASNGVIHVIDEVLLPSMPAVAPTDDIVETAVAAGFDSLAVALTKANLVSTFSGDETGPFTVFAPTNQAFVDLLAALNLNSINDIDMATLTAVLQYHVVDGIVASDQLFNNFAVSTLGGESFDVMTSNGVKIQATNTMDAEVTTADVWATNGIVHVINKVLVP